MAKHAAGKWKVGSPALQLTGKFYPIYERGSLVGTGESEELAKQLASAPELAEALRASNEAIKQLEAAAEEISAEYMQHKRAVSWASSTMLI